MPKKDLPLFVIYQPNEKEFHICLEVKGKFFCWCSYYPPTLDVRFAREVSRIKDMPAKSLPRKRIFDEGTYTGTKADTKEEAEQKIADGVKDKSVAFILNGKKLKGRFAIKQGKGGAVLQKFKDKYAQEEDVLGGDLARTISTMIPEYDERKIKLSPPRKANKKKAEEPEEEPAEEEITADKQIGNTEYHFAFYTSADEPDICLVTSANAEVLVFKRDGDEWVMQTPVKGAASKKKKEFEEYCKVLYEAQ